jgi:tetratricopeptide (TPR) repeat protein
VPNVTPPGGYSFDSAASNSGPFAPVTPPPGGFSFDTPPPGPSPFGGGFSFDTPAKAPASGAFDFTTAPSETSPDDQKKIQQYLADGDRALEAGNHQQAIDLWSRIFLIDVTNDQASERIERAKTGRRDSEHLLEGNLAAGVQAFDRKDFTTAREKFNQVLQVDPNHGPAKDYLRQINEVPVEGGASAFEMPFTPEPTPSRDIFSNEPSSDASLVPPSPASAAPAAASIPTKRAAPKVAAKPVASQRELPIRAIVIVVGLLVLGAAGWFAWTKFIAKPAVNAAAADAIFVQAASLGQKGMYDAAIALLQDVKPDDPQHDKALSMIADLQKKKGQAAEMIDGRPAAAVYQEGLAAGKAAYEARDYEAAKKAFDSAARVKPLPPDMKVLYDAASQQTGKLEGAKTLFKEQRYQDALTSLQGLQQQDPSNRSIKRMISDAHFNLGAIALQEERLPDAITEFDEVIKIDSTDDLAKRSKALAERYNGQHKDLLYKIFVKYLPMRKVT